MRRESDDTGAGHLWLGGLPELAGDAKALGGEFGIVRLQSPGGRRKPRCGLQFVHGVGLGEDPAVVTCGGIAGALNLVVGHVDRIAQQHVSHGL